ncbi:MAG: DUF1552 domain-containing protein [Salinibacterium sp.]|nr:DUF1552 domain-containing protein [Salinibacterium sp.]
MSTNRTLQEHMSRGLSRRMVLRGIGATIALPWLEAASGAPVVRAAAAPAGGYSADGFPLRMAFVFTPNGVNYDNWVPKGSETDFALSPALAPLEPVRQHVNILTGLTLDKARANGDGPGDHARASATFLTGRQARKTSGNDINIGISADQFAAQQVGHRTRLPSIEIGCENGRRAGSCDSGYACAYSSNISWHDEDTPVPKVVNPAAVFDRLFGAGNAVDSAKRFRRRTSILDYVLEDARRLESGLGRGDRDRLDEYQTAVREIERRVQRAQELNDQPAAPSDAKAPEGIPQVVSEHIDLMYDMLLLAFQTDTTRIATYMTGTAGSNRAFPELGITDGHHHLSHHKGNQEWEEKIRLIDRFHAERFARFVARMAETREGEGSLLDHCMIMHGSGISDGNRHNHENLPILMAGKAGGEIQTGRLIQHEVETPMCSLYMSMLRRMGCDVAEFGDATNPLKSLA